MSYLRWFMVAPWSRIRDGRRQKITEETNKISLYAPAISSTHPKVGVQEWKVQKDHKQITSNQERRKGNGWNS